MPTSSSVLTTRKRLIRRLGLGLIPSLLAALALPAQAQEKFCILGGKDTLSAGNVVYKRCLDVDALKNQTVVIPSNVVRIDGKGLSLCENSDSTGGRADLVYIYDNSGSMQVTHAWVDTLRRDTLFYYGLSGCANRTVSGTVQYQTGVGLLIAAKLVNGANCTDHAGDPYYARNAAFRAAMEYQRAQAPLSYAGITAFGGSYPGGVSHSVRPLQLTGNNLNTLTASMRMDNGGNTPYRQPLELAKTWLLDPAISPDSNKAIIFLTDGRPNTGDTYLQIVNGMPPVYGIYLGRPTPDTLLLADLSVRTGGKFFLIPPNRPDSLTAVVKQILNILLLNFQPNSATVQNNSLTPPQSGSAGPTDFTRQVDNSWLINFNSEVALRESTTNNIEFHSALRETRTGNLKPNDASFVLSATGQAATQNQNIIGTQFSVTCHDKPIEPNVVTSAYIKDENGDGRGDKVYLVFTRPLASLPSSLEAYWNRLGPAFLNKAPPALTLMPGSNSRILVADFSASQYPLGLTGIPQGIDSSENPRAGLPAGGVFVSQRPYIADSMGTIIDSGYVYPFDPTKLASGASATLTIDTLRIHLSERGARANELIFKFGKPINGKCTDYANARPVVPYGGNIDIDPATNMALLVVSSAQGPVPIAGDCIYLNIDGSFVDLNRNRPPTYGVILKGKRPARQIELFRGYPPVVGLSPAGPAFVLANNDPRKGGPLDYSRPNPDVPGGIEVPWIPPVGFTGPNSPLSNTAPGFSPQTPSIGTDPGRVASMPPDISTIQVISTAKYIATVVIYDTHGNFMVTFRQKFGYDGEMNNQNRIANRGMVSYLWWNLKDTHNQRAGQGVYIWKVNFLFENNKEEIEYTRTGVMRPLP